MLSKKMLKIIHFYHFYYTAAISVVKRALVAFANAILTAEADAIVTKYFVTTKLIVFSFFLLSEIKKIY